MRRGWRVLAGLLLVVAGSVAALLLLNAPATSPVRVAECLRQGTDCLQLPQITGVNLTGDTLLFPEAFAGALNLVVMPFDREQQVRAVAYVPLFQSLVAGDARLAYYSLAALPDLAPPIRLLVSGGMTAAISDPAIRQVTVLFYLQEQAALLRALAVPDTAAIQVFIFNRAGVVLHRQAGDYSDAAAASLRAALAALLPPEE
ncbi:MAG: hypothetical protein MUE40_21010 [Anaerolineae bacterium]|nr:hypothetical protein [Anaerolineae bacterium]